MLSPVRSTELAPTQRNSKTRTVIAVNPGASIPRCHDPMLTADTAKFPAASVVVVLIRPVSTFRAGTVASELPAGHVGNATRYYASCDGDLGNGYSRKKTGEQAADHVLNAIEV
jgi:hypothetical protein